MKKLVLVLAIGLLTFACAPEKEAKEEVVVVPEETTTTVDTTKVVDAVEAEVK